MSSRVFKGKEVIVIDDSDDDSTTIFETDRGVDEILSDSETLDNSPSMLSTSFTQEISERKSWNGVKCKVEPENSVVPVIADHSVSIRECQASQGISSHLTQEGGVAPVAGYDETPIKCGVTQGSEINSVAVGGTTTSDSVVKSPVKKLRKRKLLSPVIDGKVSPSEHKPSINHCIGNPAKKSRLDTADRSTVIGGRTSQLQRNPHASPVNVITSAGGQFAGGSLYNGSVSQSYQTDGSSSHDTNGEPVFPAAPVEDPATIVFSKNDKCKFAESPTGSTPKRPQENTSQFRSLSDSYSSAMRSDHVNSVSECAGNQRRKRRLFKSLDIDTETADHTHSDMQLPLTKLSKPTFLDSDIIFSHTHKISNTQLCFISQLQGHGYALPHVMILELVQEMITNSSSKCNTICNILWSDSERFYYAVNKEFLDQLFNTIIDSLMTAKYTHIENANKALGYLLNIFCVDWKNSTTGTTSLIETFLSTKVRQLLCEIRKYYEKAPDVFCLHVASTLQQLVCLRLAVMYEPQQLSEFSQLVFNEVLVELTTDKQQVFLNNLSSPYLVTQLVATLLTKEYIHSEDSKEILLYPSVFIDNRWINIFLMLCNPYLSDGREDLTRMLWLITLLLGKSLQYQCAGIVLSSPICVTNPLLTIGQDPLSNCSSLVEDLMDRLVTDDILYHTCLFTPEVCYYLKLMLAMVESKPNEHFIV